MTDLNITHVYIAGDSNMMDFSKSLRSLISKPSSEPSPPTTSTENLSKLSCGQALVTTELYQFPSDINLEPSFLNESDSGRRNLVLVNIGAGMQNLNDFKGNLTELMEWVDEWRGPRDIVFFPSIVSHRKTCAPNALPAEVTLTKADNTALLPNESEHVRSGAIDQSLDLREEFNEYARLLSSEYKVLYLNIYKSTILQHDGYPINTVHCEDYIQSENIDWWIHFLYSSLLDVRKVELQTYQRRTGH
jgi:hypothetical protein